MIKSSEPADMGGLITITPVHAHYWGHQYGYSLNPYGDTLFKRFVTLKDVYVLNKTIPYRLFVRFEIDVMIDTGCL